MAKKATAGVGQVYRVKITLMDSKPPIWRRVLAPASFSLHQLHEMIQIAMGWTDNHLHIFTIDGQNYGVPHPDDWEPVIDERRFTLSEIAPEVNRKFIYEYDFGDSWEHQILVEEISEAEAGVTYPVYIKGKRACPPEDIGGIWGYAEFLRAIADPGHKEHDMYVDWLGDDFDPEAFDLDEINQELRQMK